MFLLIKSKRQPADKAEKGLAVSLFEKTNNANEVSRQLKRKNETVLRWLREAGITTSKKIAPELKNEASRLYHERQIGTPQIARLLGISTSSAKSQLKRKGELRTASERSALSAKQGYYAGKSGWWQSSITGKWEPAASSYEMARMALLDGDSENVAHWTRDVPLIPYSNGKTYTPDIIVTYKNGLKVIEEIKPDFQTSTPLNQKKWAAARTYAQEHGYEFKVLTEHDIGIEFIKKMRLQGLQEISETEKAARRKAKDREYRQQNKDKKSDTDRKYRQSNRELLQKYFKRYYETNKEKKKEYDKQYLKQNREKKQEYRKEYHQANKEKIIAKVRKWQLENIEARKEYMRLYHLKNKAKQNAESKQYYETHKENH